MGNCWLIKPKEIDPNTISQLQYIMNNNNLEINNSPRRSFSHKFQLINQQMNKLKPQIEIDNNLSQNNSEINNLNTGQLKNKNQNYSNIVIDEQPDFQNESPHIKRKIVQEDHDYYQANQRQASQIADDLLKLQLVARDDKKKDVFIEKGTYQEENEIISENIKFEDKNKDISDLNLIIKCLQEHFVFNSLQIQELKILAEKFQYCYTGANQFLFKQNDVYLVNIADIILIDKGIVEIIINGEVKRQLKQGKGFGELALLYSAPRSASIYCIENCNFWAIKRKDFKEAIQDLVTRQKDENIKFLNDVQFFKIMTDSQKNVISNIIITEQYLADQYIVHECDPANSFYIIKEGSVRILKGNKEIRKMGKGSSFGEQALYYNTVRSMSVQAIDNVTVLSLGKEIAHNAFGDQIQIITFKNNIRWYFEKNEFLSKLTPLQIEKVMNYMEISHVKTGDVILQEETVLNKIIVVLDGVLRKGGYNQEDFNGVGSIYGMEAILNIDPNSIQVEENLIMKSNGIIAQISIFDFLKQIGGKWEFVLQRNKVGHELSMLQVSKANNLQNFDKNIQLSELYYIKQLGNGQFGTVYLCQRKKNRQNYALKTILKNQILKNRLEKHLKQEKQVLELVQFPFCMQYIKSFKDKNFIYFLTEFIRGMELFDVIREIGLLKKFDSQFYVASMILVLEYLHTCHSIVYRDIKPENIMIDQTGYLKLIDMGTGKILDKSNPRTFTIIGTPHYIAPEIIQGKGYSFPVDLWSVGICLYEFICGMVPFAEKSDDPYQIYEEIIKKPLKYPNYVKDKKSKKMIERLLNKLPEARLGGSFANLKSDQWFESFDWDKLFNKEMKPPFIPKGSKLIPIHDIDKIGDKHINLLNIIQKDKANDIKEIQKPNISNWDQEY